jgi:predicted aspartyl protease
MPNLSPTAINQFLPANTQISKHNIGNMRFRLQLNRKLLTEDAKLVAKKSSTNRNGEDEQVIIVENNQTGEYVEFSNINKQKTHR